MPEAARRPRRYVVRRSPIQGRGVFARTALRPGERLAEYGGERISWDEALRRFEATGVEGHTFLFTVDEHTVIDGAADGNSMRWLNHGCAANCQAVEEDGRIHIEVIRAVRPGEELLIDYQLEVDTDDPDVLAAYACRCRARNCRGTMTA